MNTTLAGSVLPRSKVVGALADRLFDLFQRHYGRVSRRTFDRDLTEKNWVVLLRDEAGEVRGFTTLMLYDLLCPGRRIRAVFSGNTIVDPSHWGSQELVRTWRRFMHRLKAEMPTVPLYWYLICSGYRTYLYLPLFFREFFPRHDRGTPEDERALIDRLGRLKFPEEYGEGVVRVKDPRECLREDLAVPPPHKLANPHVRFFVRRNPGYLRGDEMVCLAEFSAENLRRPEPEAAVPEPALR
jgi:hypothetical protein